MTCLQSRRGAPGCIGSFSGRDLREEGLGVATPMVDAFRGGNPTAAGVHSGLLLLAPKVQSRAAAPRAARAELVAAAIWSIAPVRYPTPSREDKPCAKYYQNRVYTHRQRELHPCAATSLGLGLSHEKGPGR